MAGGLKGVSQVDQGRMERRGQFGGPLQQGDGHLRMADGAEQGAEQVQGVDVVRVAGEDFPVARNRGLKPSGLVVGESALKRGVGLNGGPPCLSVGSPGVYPMGRGTGNLGRAVGSPWDGKQGSVSA